MRVTINKLQEMKKNGEKIAMLTAYDYSTAKLVDEVGIPLILVGDSLGNVILGYDTTIPVTMEDMLHHTKAVVRGSKQAMVIGDMPFMTYHTDKSSAMLNAARFLQEGGCQAIKLEGGVTVAETVRDIVNCGIPVMGHIGFTPQSVNQIGVRVQGKTHEAAAKMIKDAIALEQAGAFAVVIEMTPAPLAKLITQKLTIPTIGIGAGKDCDGQVLVINDMLGLYTDFVPKHTRQYAQLSVNIKSALQSYMDDVRSGAFPSTEHSSSMDETLLKDLKG